MSIDNTNKIAKFLNVRNNRIDAIEIASKMYTIIGNSLPPLTRSKFNDDPYLDGCVYQFFAFNQMILSHFIFNSFIAIIGNYDGKRNSLKAWENFHLNNEKILILKEIRNRYAEVRNNLIAHISINFVPSENHDIPTAQIEEDIQKIRDILNLVRKSKEIPIVIQGYDGNKNYAIAGVVQLLSTNLQRPS